MLRTVHATRYVAPLREGGSLPGLVEADDEGLYVVKFRGAGQGAKALIAELLGGEIARALGLLVPEIVFIELDPRLGRSEPDMEIQELLQASGGLNLALDYLPGSLNFDPLVDPPAPELASAIVWLDAYLTNVDRTARNPNLLHWHRRLWLVDHGAALYFQHTWSDYLARSQSRFPQIADHVLLPHASCLREADQLLSERLTPELLHYLVSLIPAAWLGGEAQFATLDAQRDAFTEFLLARLAAPRLFVEEALDARARLL